jgi:hypothetical protein
MYTMRIRTPWLYVYHAYTYTMPMRIPCLYIYIPCLYVCLYWCDAPTGERGGECVQGGQAFRERRVHGLLILLPILMWWPIGRRGGEQLRGGHAWRERRVHGQRAYKCLYHAYTCAYTYAFRVTRRWAATRRPCLKRETCTWAACCAPWPEERPPARPSQGCDSRAVDFRVVGFRGFQV